jgi:hypothetical protein
MRLDLQARKCIFGILVLAGGGFLLAQIPQTLQTPQASPNFSLSINPTSTSITAGHGTAPILLAAAALNGFKGTVEVKVSNLPAGVTATPETFSLSPGKTQLVKLLASPAALGASRVRFTGTSGALTHIAYVSVTVKIDVITHHFNVARTGLNASETTLTPANVNAAHFGLLHKLPTDGLVDAQPLLLSNLTIAGKEHDVVYAVTENDSVYAFDAETGARLWKVTVLRAGENPSDDHNCGQITPEIGITSTPVIDRNYGPHGAIFVVGMSLDGSGNYHQRLHALDVTTGAELPHSPVEINATYPGSGPNSTGGKLTFDPGQYAERAGLLLMKGTIYLGWTSHCDGDPYNGWLMGYSESTLTQTSVLNLTPNGTEGSIWMTGSGLAADEDGFIYFLDANGTFDTTLNAAGFPKDGDYGNGFIKVSTANGKLAVADYFEMYDTVNESNNDDDLGSGGVIVLPGLEDSARKTHYLAVGAGKDENIYVVNREAMGKFNPNNDKALYEEVDGAIGGVWSKPAYFHDTVYYGAVGDTVKAFPMVNAKLAQAPSAQSTNYFQYPGTTPSISAYGIENGIVWCVENASPAVLHAYRAADLVETYNSNQAAHNRDQFGNGNKFIVPMIANGRVYAGTPSGVAVFGLLP